MKQAFNLIKSPISNKVSWRRGSIDPISDFLELNLSDSFHTLRYYFHLEYCRIYTKWANGRIHNQDVFDTDKCEYFINVAENRLREIVPTYPRRFWFDAFRRMDLYVLNMITGDFSIKNIRQYIFIGSLAIIKFSIPCQPTKIEFPEKIDDILSVKKIKYAKRNFTIDLGKFLGVIHALTVAQEFYRFAGKGGELVPPQKISMKNFPDFDKFPQDAIFMMPCIESKNIERLNESISIYEKRRDRHKGFSVSGFYKNPTFIHLADAKWWQMDIVGEPLKFPQITVSYPNFPMKIFSSSYIVFPNDISDEIKLLMHFADNFELSYGFDFDSFRIMCQNLFDFVFEETGFSELHSAQLKTSEDSFEIISKLSEKSVRSKTAPLHLYNLFARAIFKVSKDKLIEILARGLNSKYTGASPTAEKFIEEFTCKDSNLFFHDLTPCLFYQLDKKMIALDFMRANSFMELCLRKVSSTGGRFPNIRGDMFAKQTREVLIEKLKLNREQIPIKPEQKFRINKLDYGDIDFAFIWKNILIHIDIKSYQMSSEYLKGDFRAVRNRQLEAQKQMSEKSSNIEKRGMKLLEILNNREELKLSGVLNFICVPFPLYISLEYENLWYEDIPRVLTPSELAHIMADDQKILQLKNLIN